MRSEQVIIVDDDKIRSVTIGPGQRLRPALLAAAALSGMLVASAGWMATAFALRDSRDSIFQMDQGAQNLATQLSDSREQLARVASDLEKARQALDQALAEEAGSQARIDAALAVLTSADQDGTKTPRQLLAAVRNELAPLRLDAGDRGDHLRAAQESLQLITDISQEAASRRAQSAIAALSLVLEEAEALPSSQPTLALASEGLGKALAEAQAQAQRARAEAETAWTERNEMATALAGSEQRMTEIAAGQVALLTRLTEHAELRIGAIEGELKNTGLNLDKVLRAVGQSPRGVGGPLIGLPELPGTLPAAAQAALNQLESRLDRQAKLRALANYLPLTPPVDNFYVSSGFGSRRDPFTNQWAAHEGLDLVAKEGSPVTLPAAGRVVAITFDEGYGHMVEVDHGLGIRTRYAHMKKVMVKEGEMLDPGRQVGTLGDSGRSSGPHLHYEVLLEGRPVDPLRFMERGRHVCEG